MNLRQDAPAPPPAKERHFARLLVGLAVTVVVLVVIMLAVSHFGRSSAFRRATALRVGDTKARVLEAMGRPVTEFRKNTMLLNRSNPETWVYGKRFTLKNSLSSSPPFFWPVRFRFGPLSDDIAIEFDDTGVVTSVLLPEPSAKAEKRNTEAIKP